MLIPIINKKRYINYNNIHYNNINYNNINYYYFNKLLVIFFLLSLHPNYIIYSMNLFKLYGIFWTSKKCDD